MTFIISNSQMSMSQAVKQLLIAVKMNIQIIVIEDHIIQIHQATFQISNNTVHQVLKGFCYIQRASHCNSVSYTLSNNIAYQI